MTITKTWLNVSLLAGVLMAVVSAAGIFTAGVYSKEHVSWAAQGYGQDIINLFVVFPALLASAYFIRKGSTRSILVWLGIVIYMTYSYVLYAFFMHFGSWFPVYVAILGLSFYTLVGSLIQLSRNTPAELSNTRKGPSIYLLVNGSIFAILWILEIIPRLIDGQTPKSATDVGLWLNPVHVMDLGFILPAMILVSILLWKRRPLGYLLAAPLIIFAVIMGVAIISMTLAMKERGISDTFGPAPIMALNVIIGLYFVYKFLKNSQTSYA